MIVKKWLLKVRHSPVFILSWLVPFVLYFMADKNEVYADAMLILLCAGISVIGFPMLMKDKYEVDYRDPASKKRLAAGACLLLLAVVLEAALSGSWFKILRGNPPDIVRFKYALAALPLALTVTSGFYLVLVRLIKANLKNPGMIPAAALSAAYTGLLLSALNGLNFETFLVISAAGLAAFFGLMLTGNTVMTFISIYLIMYSNALSGDMLAGLSAGLMVPLSIFSVVILMILLMFRESAEDRGPLFC